MRYYCVFCYCDDSKTSIGIYSHEKDRLYAQDSSDVQHEYRADIGIFVFVDRYWCVTGSSD